MNQPAISKPRNRCALTVDLRFFQDDANGEWGLTHKDTMQSDRGTDGFNAFYDAQGLFHDVFEHHHEHTNRFFRGDYAMNVGGEMAAMGAMWYYYSRLGLSRRLNSAYHAPGAMMRQTTESLVTEAIGEGYCQFGHTLESNVPRQSPIEDSELEYQIEELYQKARTYRRREYGSNTVGKPVQDAREEERQYGEHYRQSVTRRKVKDLHRWGYRYAKRLIPDRGENHATLSEFFEFKIYRSGEGLISWKAWIVPQYGSSKVRVTQYLMLDDLYADEAAQ